MKTLIMMYVLAGGSCLMLAGSPEPHPASETLCAVLGKAVAHNGTEVVVTGQYVRAPHGTVLMTIGCAQNLVNLRNAADTKSNRRDLKALASILAHGQPAEVTLRGTFRVAKPEECFGQMCAPYEIEVAEIVSVRVGSSPAR